MKLLMSLTLLALVLTGCSSTKREISPEERENEDIERDFLVRDASSNIRPGWIEDSEVWAKEHGKDIKKYRYFSFETAPKRSREISCKIAKANARTDIAGEIRTFIDQSLGISSEGAAGIDENDPDVKGMREFVENTLVEKIQALIHGAAVMKTYWEKRKYMKDRGAKKDYTAWTCAVFVRMPNDRLQNAIDEAARHVLNNVDDPGTKAKVQKALENAANDFVKAKQGVN